MPKLMLLNHYPVEQLGYASTQLLKNGCSGEGSLWSDVPSEGFYCLCEGDFCNDPNSTVQMDTNGYQSGMDTRVAISLHKKCLGRFWANFQSIFGVFIMAIQAIYRLTMVITDSSGTWVGLTMILVIPLAARFCLGRWELGRIGWVTGQDGRTSQNMVYPTHIPDHHCHCMNATL